jgi:serine/threonine-protein kinase
MTGLLDRLNAALAGRYSVQSEIGQGGMATVFLAEDLKHRRKVAIKVLKPEIATEVATERFLREIKIVAGLRTRTFFRSTTRARPMACCTA